MENLSRVRQALIAALIGVGVVGGAATLMRQPAPEPIDLVEEEPTPDPIPSPAMTETPAPIVVFVSGAVLSPGVYTLPPQSRVVDALEAAGGPTEDAMVEALNQATLLADGMQIHMPREGEAAPPPLAPGGEDGLAGDAPSGGPLVRINSASQTELETLPGIGPALAGRIIEYREANGPFTSVEQLQEVRGIGEKLLEDLRDYVVLE